MTVSCLLAVLPLDAPLQDLPNHVEFWQIAAGVATVATALFILLPKVRKFIILPIAGYLTLIIKAPAALQDIQAQLRPNGGFSLADRVNQLKDQMVKVEALLHAKTLLENEARFWTNGKGENVGVNNAYFRLFDCAYPDVDGFNFKHLIAESEASDYLQSWLSSVELGCDFLREVRLKNVKGADLGKFLVHAVPLKDQDDKIMGFEGVIRKIDDPDA